MKLDVKILDARLHEQLPQYATTGSAAPASTPRSPSNRAPHI